MVASLSLSEEEWGSVRHRGENKLIYLGCALLIVSVIHANHLCPSMLTCSMLESSSCQGRICKLIEAMHTTMGSFLGEIS
jgi:hypothetical protein